MEASMKKLLEADKEIVESFNTAGLGAWVKLYKYMTKHGIGAIGGSDLPPELYNAAQFYKEVKHYDWGHPRPESALRNKGVATNLTIGLNAPNATVALNEFAVSISTRTLLPLQKVNLNKLAEELLMRCKKPAMAV